MPLSKLYADMLQGAGFLPEEIEEFSRAVTPKGYPMRINAVMKSDAAKKMMEERAKWWKWVMAPEHEGGLGWSRLQAWQRLKSNYEIRRGVKKSVWDFLRMEYRGSAKRDYKLTDYEFARAVKAKRGIIPRLRRYSTRLPRRRRPIETTQPTPIV